MASDLSSSQERGRQKNPLEAPADAECSAEGRRMRIGSPVLDLERAYSFFGHSPRPVLRAVSPGLPMLPGADEVSWHDIHVLSVFDQQWPSTSLGFDENGRPGDFVATSAVLELKRRIVVFFAGRPAYEMTEVEESSTFWTDLEDRRMASVLDAEREYGATRIYGQPAMEDSS